MGGGPQVRSCVANLPSWARMFLVGGLSKDTGHAHVIPKSQSHTLRSLYVGQADHLYTLL